MELEVPKREELKHSYLLVKKDRSDSEVLRRELLQEPEVQKRDVP